MIASNVYISDADWHDIYDAPLRPVLLRQLPLSAMSGWAKGEIVQRGDGENTVIGAVQCNRRYSGNVIAAGNRRVSSDRLPGSHIGARDHVCRQAAYEKTMKYLDGLTIRIIPFSVGCARW